MKHKNVLWITQTAIFLALLIAAQAFVANQFVRGSIVNFILVASCILVGFSSAASLAVISPIFSFLILSVPIFPHLVPFIILGNFTIIAAVHFISGKSLREEFGMPPLRVVAATVTGVVLKYLATYFGVVQIALYLIPNINENQRAAMSLAFSWPQLVTAFIGAGLAVFVVPSIRKALNSNYSQNIR